MIKHPLAAAALAVAAIATLAGCTSTVSAETAGRTPGASPTSTAPQAVTMKCVDGFMLIDADTLERKKLTKVTEACATVSVVGSNATLELAGADRLVIEGNSIDATVAKITSVAFAGNDNTVRPTGAAPTIDDKGADNVVTAAG